MREIHVGMTRKRLAGGLAVLVVASTVLLGLGVEPVAYLSGVAVGLVAVGLVYVWTTRRREAGGRATPDPMP